MTEFCLRRCTLVRRGFILSFVGLRCGRDATSVRVCQFVRSLPICSKFCREQDFVESEILPRLRFCRANILSSKNFVKQDFCLARILVQRDRQAGVWQARMCRARVCQARVLTSKSFVEQEFCSARVLSSKSFPSKSLLSKSFVEH